MYDPNGEAFPGDPRGVLRRQLDRAKKLGFTLNTGPELEFFLLQRENGTVQPLPHDAAGYFDLSEDLGTEVRKEMMNALEEFGIKVETGHHEVATGQHEIDFEYADALRTADNAVTFKTTLKAVAASDGPVRHLHAEAVLRHQRLGHAHPHEPLGRQEGPQRLRRPERPVRPVGPGEAATSPACSTTRAA